MRIRYTIAVMTGRKMLPALPLALALTLLAAPAGQTQDQAALVDPRWQIVPDSARV